MPLAAGGIFPFLLPHVLPPGIAELWFAGTLWHNVPRGRDGGRGGKGS